MLLDRVTFIVDAFQRDQSDGYQTKDRSFVLELLAPLIAHCSECGKPGWRDDWTSKQGPWFCSSKCHGMSRIDDYLEQQRPRGV